MRSLYSYFQSAVQAMGIGRSAPLPAPAKAEPVRAPVVADPVRHDEKFLRTLLHAFYHAAPYARTAYANWSYYSKPDDQKRQEHFDVSLADLQARRLARHEERERMRGTQQPLPPLRPDELKSLRLSSDRSFPIQARGAKNEFIHQLQAFLLSLTVAKDNVPAGPRAGYLRKEFSFAPLPESKDNAALKQEVVAHYGALRREVEEKADLLLRLMGDVLNPPRTLSPVTAAVSEIIVQSVATDLPDTQSARLPEPDVEPQIILLPPQTGGGAGPAAQIR